MNDRYLFKAKRKYDSKFYKKGEWVDGAYYIEPYTDKCFIIQWNSTGLGFNEFIEVDGSSVCQCTGLKDKNGKLIWENDIVKHDFGKDQIGVQLAIVKYDIKYACYQIKPIYDWMYCDKSDCEVIGNIFDNPELLEVGE